MHETSAAAAFQLYSTQLQPASHNLEVNVNEWAERKKDNHTNNNLQNHKYQTTCTAQQHKISNATGNLSSHSQKNNIRTRYNFRKPNCLSPNGNKSSI